MEVTVLMNPTCEHGKRIEEMVRLVNQLQSHFRLEWKYVRWLPNDVEEETFVSGDAVHARIAQRLPGRNVIAITQSGIEPDLLVDERRHSSLVTVAEWESRFAPPPLRIYLMFEIASALLNFAADLSDEQIEGWAHQPAIGCAFDWYRNPHELKRCMVAANICGVCEVRLAEMGISDLALGAVEQILAFVRAATIRRPRSTPTAVFIGHGHSDVWREVRDFVSHTLKLQVQEFNQEPAAGVSTAERLQSMLNSSAFAILVMTGEDFHDDLLGGQTLHARENVVHEIGLFQGRLGFRRAVVLREEGTAVFSNIHGLTDIFFTKGNFRDDENAKDKLRGAMQREGVL